MAEAGVRTMTVSEFVDRIRLDPPPLPERTILVTFDDGFADFAEVALPAMTRRGISSTLYATTSFVQRGGPRGDRMLDFGALVEVAAAGVEVGGHGHAHLELDTVPAARAREEAVRCKQLLEDRLAGPVRTFAYPHGYSSRRVRAIVRETGYDSACGVGNAFSSPGDDTYRLARLLVRRSDTAETVTGWIRGDGAPVAGDERFRTAAWRLYRRAGVRLGVRDSFNL